MRDWTLTRLFERFRDRGDGAALAAVFDHTARRLLAVACHLVRDAAEAEDLVQATFVTAIQRARSFDGSAPLEAWLHGILWREAAKVRRRAARRVEPEWLAERAGREPLDELVLAEVPPAVARALAGLPRASREVLVPLLQEGKRADEIARELGRSPGTVRSQIHRGLERLRRALPAGLAPASGMAVVPTRGLRAVRAEVLNTAGVSPAAAATIAGALAAHGATLNALLGGVLVSKTLLVTGAVAAAALAGAWLAWERTAPAGRGELAAAAPAPRARPAATAPPRSDAPPESDAPASGAVAERRALASGEPEVARSPDDAVRFWRARFDEAPDNWRHGWAVAAEIAALPPDEALRIMTAVWAHLSVAVKEQALKPFVFDGGHPHALPLLGLAARDESIAVQNRAFTYLEAYAFQDFSTDYEAYLRWAETYERMPVAEALSANARRFVADMLALSPQALGERMLALDRLDLRAGAPAGLDLAEVMREAGGLRVLEAGLASADPEIRRRALRWSKTLRADETWLRRWALPAVQGVQEADAEILGASFDALARADCGWAREPVVAFLARAQQEGRPRGVRYAAARALAEIGDPAAIPGMIEIVLADETGEMAYDVGYFGLAKLTGVDWQESYDGEWWAAWWERNRARFPAAVSAMTVRR